MEFPDVPLAAAWATENRKERNVQRFSGAGCAGKGRAQDLSDSIFIAERGEFSIWSALEGNKEIRIHGKPGGRPSLKVRRPPPVSCGLVPQPISFRLPFPL